MHASECKISLKFKPMKATLEYNALAAKSRVIQKAQCGFPCPRPLAKACLDHFLNERISTLLRKAPQFIQQAAFLVGGQVANLNGSGKLRESFAVQLDGNDTKDRCQATVILDEVNAGSGNSCPYNRWYALAYLSGTLKLNKSMLLQVIQVKYSGFSLAFRKAFNNTFPHCWVALEEALKQYFLQFSIQHSLALEVKGE